MDALRDERQQKKQDEEAQRLQKIKDQLQPDETVEAEFRTAEVMMWKDLVFTSKRLIVVRGENMESIPYRAMTGFTTENFMPKGINLWVAGRKHKLELTFTDAADRDRALEILNKHAL